MTAVSSDWCDTYRATLEGPMGLPSDLVHVIRL